MTAPEQSRNALAELCDDGEIGWTAVCVVDRLTPDRGVCALVAGEPVAIFRLSTGELYAISGIDPFSRANVMSRGIVGDVDGVPFVASPMHKQRFDLRTGACIDDPDHSVAAYPARAAAGVVWVRRPA